MKYNDVLIIYRKALMMAREEVEVIGEIEQFTISTGLEVLRESCGDDKATIHDNNTIFHNLTPLITLWSDVVSAGKRVVESTSVPRTFSSPSSYHIPCSSYSTLWKAE